MAHAFVLCVLTASLTAAVYFDGGFHPQTWEWSALGIGVAATVSIAAISKENRSPKATQLFAILALLLGWMVFQLVPLPPLVIESVSKEHWNAVATARRLTGQDPAKWVALSLAPAATWQRLMDVLPAAAAFVVAREMGWWWRDRLWISLAPVIGVAWFESLLGLAQFYLMRIAGGETGSASGTYANRDHFAGLLEMAFPLALLGAIALWRRSASDMHQRIGPALAAALLLGVSACLLMGIVVSLSRMGFLSTLAAAGLTAIVLLVRRFEHPGGVRRTWRWLAALSVPLFITALLPTRELLLRFADLAATKDISQDERMQIWQDTTKVIADYAWTGTGLGAYERGLYLCKTVEPTRTVDFAHNDYLQVLAELGLAGAIPAAILGILVFLRPLSAVLRGPGSLNWEWSVGLLAALLSIGIHSLADFNLYIPANALTFAWLSGVAVSPGLGKN